MPVTGVVHLAALPLEAGPTVVGNLAVRTPPEAVSTVERYLADRTWGFFGAACDAWLSMHYRPTDATVGYLTRSSEWVVDIQRRPEALGPNALRYFVNARTGLTYGDEAHKLNSDFAEGCDKY
jgi:hypothetical protein